MKRVVVSPLLTTPPPSGRLTQLIHGSELAVQNGTTWYPASIIVVTVSVSKARITTSINLATSPATLAEVLQPSLAQYCDCVYNIMRELCNLQPITAYRPIDGISRRNVPLWIRKKLLSHLPFNAVAVVKAATGRGRLSINLANT